jgi:hypothetical protein
MSRIRKFRPNWDHAFFLERTRGAERERAIKPPPEHIGLPEYQRFNRWRLIAAWKAIDVDIDPELVLGHALLINLWRERE